MAVGLGIGLPLELHWNIVSGLTSLGDLAALSASNRHLYHTTIYILYERAAASSPWKKRVLFSGAATGLPRTVELALNAGVYVNWEWITTEPGFAPFEADIAPQTRGEPARGSRLVDCEELPQKEVRYRWSALHVAAMSRTGSAETVEVLLRHGALIDVGSSGLCDCKAPPKTVGGISPGHLLSPRWTALHLAMCSGNRHIARLLISRGVSLYADVPSGQGPEGRTLELTALHDACRFGHLDLVRLLVEERDEIDLNAVDAFRQTPLMYAYLNGHWDCFDYLLSQGTDINFDSSRHEMMPVSMLANAMSNRSFRDALRLMDRGMGTKVTIGYMPLLHFFCMQPWDSESSATQESREDQYNLGLTIFERLLKAGANAQESASYLGAALTFAAGAANTIIMRRLLEEGAHVDGDPKSDFSPLAQACRNPHGKPMLEPVTLLVESGASANQADVSGSLPIWLLFLQNLNLEERREAFDLLLQNGARCDRGTYDSNSTFNTLALSPLGLMLRRGDPAGFQELLAWSAADSFSEDKIASFWQYATRLEDAQLFMTIFDLDTTRFLARDHSLWSLSSAIRYRSMSVDVIIRLLDHSIDANGKDASDRYKPRGDTLHKALKHHAPPVVVEALLARGADANHMVSGRTPIYEVMCQWSMNDGRCRECLRLLLDAGASIHQRQSRKEEIKRDASFDDCLFQNRVFPFQRRQRQEQQKRHHPLKDGPPTPLGIAIDKMTPTAEVVDYMLERQPLRDALDVGLADYVVAACARGNTRALHAIIASTEAAPPLIASQADNLFHHTLYHAVRSWECIHAVDGVIDVLQLLLEEHGANLRSTCTGTGVSDGRTAGEKVAEIVREGNVDDVDMWDLGLRWCFRRRLDVKYGEEGEASVVFKPRTPLDRSKKLSVFELGWELADMDGRSGYPRAGRGHWNCTICGAP